jgi:hypothetical protein
MTAGGSVTSFPPTGTSLDQLFPALERGYHAQQVIIQGIQLVDDIFVTQQRQQDHLSKLDASLANVSTFAPLLTKGTGEDPSVHSDTHKMRTVRPGSEQDPASDTPSPLAQGLQVFEDASQRSRQARQLGTQIMQKLRDLRKLMSKDPRIERAH